MKKPLKSVCDTCGKCFQTHHGMKIHRKNHDLESQRRRSNAAKKRQECPETLERQSSAAKEACGRPEVRERRSKASKVAWARPGAKEHRTILLRKARARLEVRERRSRVSKEVQNRLDVKERKSRAMKEVCARSEVRERRSRMMKEACGRPDVRERRRLSQDSPKAHMKRHETMKRNGSYGKKMTKPEKAFQEYLHDRFGCDDIEYQKFINRWPIDFYIKSLDAYIQVDGVYWHGLDRSVEEIQMFRSPRDRAIWAKMQTDKKQDEWFKAVGMKLFRINENDVLSSNFATLDLNLSIKELT